MAATSMQTILHLIDGEQVEPTSGRWLDNVDPATGAVYSRLPDGDEADVTRAVAAATRAFPQWSRTPAEERSRVLLRLADLVESNLERLARAESIDNGKPLALARSLDIPRAASNLRFFATAILHTRSESYATDQGVTGGGAALNTVLRTPRGVVGAISPWNLPLYLFTWKIAPALAVGSTVVAKPSEVTPMTAFMLGELAVEAGLPRGVLNIVHGLGPKVGAPLVAHPEVPTITFTGGTATGAAIAQSAGPLFKKLSLELGGKNATIVFDDADLATAVPAAVRAAFANQGEICLCGSRVLVARPIFERFSAEFVERSASLRVGDPLEAATEQGALVSKAHLDKVRSSVELARAEGGTVLCGGDAPRDLPARCRNGFFLSPTVITGLDGSCRVNREEIFGPVATLIPFDSEEEALAIANGTPYGLSASVWTRNIHRAQRIARGLDVGTVWVNCWLLRDLRVPFGGTKQSGIGREGGDEALRFFTEMKTVCWAE